MRRRVRGAILVVLGLVLTISGALLYAHQEQQAHLAGQSAQQLLQDLSLDMQERQMNGIVVEAPEEQMLQVTVDGEAMIGILQVDEAGITLPVLAQWDYEKLKRAPCRYSGSLEGDDLILLGHNYERHFGQLDQLETGDAVTFIDVEGGTHRYAVVETTVLQPTQVEELTAQPYPLTIFTCTPGGQSRFVVFCDHAEKSAS